MSCQTHADMDDDDDGSSSGSGSTASNFYCHRRPTVRSTLSGPARRPRPKPSPLRIFDDSGRVATLQTLRYILSNMRSRQVAQAHPAIHMRLATRCEFEERRKLLRLLARLDYFPDDTLPAYFGCMRIDGAPQRIKMAGKQMNFTTALRWLCTEVDDELLDSARSAELPGKQPAYKQQIVSMCNTSNCVNPQHYNERLYAKKQARARRHELLADLRAMDNGLDEMVGQMYMADMDHAWIRTERELARDPKVHSVGGVEHMLVPTNAPDFVLEHSGALFACDDDERPKHAVVSSECTDDASALHETRPLRNGPLLRERVLEPIGDNQRNADEPSDMLCDN